MNNKLQEFLKQVEESGNADQKSAVYLYKRVHHVSLRYPYDDERADKIISEINQLASDIERITGE